jgi:hypothetical protein
MSLRTVTNSAPNKPLPADALQRPLRFRARRTGASGLPRPPAAELEAAPFDYWVPHPN